MGALVSLIAGVLGRALSLVMDYFSAAARLARKEKAEAVDTAKQEVEGERLQSAYHRIETEAPKTDPQELANRLRQKFPPKK